MAALIFLLLNLAASLFKPRGRLEAENAALRQQLIVLQRKVRGRVQFTNRDRLFFVQLYRSFPSALKAITIIRPETLVRWHRAGFRRYWRRKISKPGRPTANLCRGRSTPAKSRSSLGCRAKSAVNELPTADSSICAARAIRTMTKRSRSLLPDTGHKEAPSEQRAEDRAQARTGPAIIGSMSPRAK
jgi:hypothetical protein